MEITILGSRHFLITMTQSGFKSPTMRYCVVEIVLGSLKESFLLKLNTLTPNAVASTDQLDFLLQQ